MQGLSFQFKLSFQLSQQVETLNDKITCSNADLKADIERWHKTKRKDFRRIFMAMADRQIQYYQKVCEGVGEIYITDTHIHSPAELLIYHTC